MSKIKRFFSNYASRLRMFSRNIRLLLLGETFVGVGMTFWFLLFNLYLRKLGGGMGMAGEDLSRFIGHTTAVGQIAAAALALPAGYLAGRVNQKSLLIVSHCLSSFAFIGALFSPQPVSMYPLLIIAFGLSVFIWVVTGPFTMANTTGKERTYVFSFAFTLRLAGGVVGNIVAGYLKELAAGAGVPEVTAYRYTILGGIVFGLLGIIPFLLIRSPKAPPREADKLNLKSWRSFDWALFAKALFPTALLGTGAGLIVQFMNLYLKDTFPFLSDARIGFFLSLQFGTMAFGILLAPVLAERFGKVRTIVGTQLASIPFMLALALTKQLWLAVLALVVRASLMNMSGPVSNTLILELCRKREQGLLMALFSMNWTLAWAFAAVLYGRMEGNYTLMFLTAVGLYLASTSLYYMFFRGAEAEIARRAPAAEERPETFSPK